MMRFMHNQTVFEKYGVNHVYVLQTSAEQYLHR